MKLVILACFALCAAAAPGGKVPLTPQELESRQFKKVQKAASLEFHTSAKSNLHVITRVARATKQVVAGMLYEFDAIFSETVCINNIQNINKGIDECPIQSGRQTVLCQMEVLDQPWNSRMPVVTKISCNDGFQLGGLTPLTEEDIQSAEFQKCLGHANDELEEMELSDFEHGFKQVVNGILFHFTGVFKDRSGAQTKCPFKCLVSPFLIHGAPTGNVVLFKNGECRQSSAFGLVGGKSPITQEDMESPSFQVALQMATSSFNNQHNSMFHHAFFKLVSGTKQVVSGVVYNFRASMVKTLCRNGPENAHKGLDECPRDSMAPISVVCTFRVHYIAWNPSASSITVSECA